jgi:hypothetical protein
MQLARILLLVVVTDDSGTSFEPSGGFVAGLRLNSLWDGSRPGSQDSARGLPIGVVKALLAFAAAINFAIYKGYAAS